MSRQVNTTSRPGIFAQRLNEALNGTTSEAFARRIGVTLRTVQRWRADEGQPTASTLMLISDALGREPSWFFTAEEQIDALSRAAFAPCPPSDINTQPPTED